MSQSEATVQKNDRHASEVACPYGTHRGLEPKGSLPQQAWKIDNRMEIRANEILVDVETLNIDAASFVNLSKEAGGDPTEIGRRILSIVSDRGKMHNPATGSGGMFVGTVAAVGSALQAKGVDVKAGDRIASLVSLSLTPLRIDAIKRVKPDQDQVEIQGQAILFESGIYAKIPSDMPPALVLAVLDVAGAPAQTAKLVKFGDRVLIIGAAGKSGLLCLHEARKQVGGTGQVIGLCHREASRALLEESGLADEILVGDAGDAVATMGQVFEATGGRLADVTINCVNLPGTEMGAILATRDGGTVYFFSMATSFTAAALGAEGAGKDVTMIIGNGYTKGHDKVALQVLAESPFLRKYFEEHYA